MGRESSTRQNDSSGAFFEDCDSEELEAIITRGFCPTNEPSDSQTTSTTIGSRSERMSFAKWTPEDLTNWTCVYCTYVNEPLHLTCATCEKAKGAPSISQASDSHLSFSSNEDDGCDPFLEQLQRERHAEMMELQYNILRDVAIERSTRSNGIGTAEEIKPSDLKSEREAQELRKILSLQVEDASSDTQLDSTNTNTSTNGGSPASLCSTAANRSLKPPPPSQQPRQGGQLANSTQSLPRQRATHEGALGTSTNSLPARLGVGVGNLCRAPQPDEDTALDSDIMAKLAARSHTGAGRDRVRLDMDDDIDMPNLTSMIDTAEASSQPGAYQQRPGAQPVRASSTQRCSLSDKTKGYPVRPKGVNSSYQAQDGTEIDDDILRKIAANAPATGQQGPADVKRRGGAQSEDDLDEDILQKIAACPPAAKTRQYQSHAEGKRPGAHDEDEASKNSAPVSPTVSFNDAASSPPSNGKSSTGVLRKAANGFKKFGMLFRKQKDR